MISTQQLLGSSVLPSQIMGIEDEYTAFCFNEACAYIIERLKNKEEPILKNNSSEKTYSKPSDFYKKFD